MRSRSGDDSSTDATRANAVTKEFADAANAYAAVAPRAASVRRVVVIAPAHHARLRGLADARPIVDRLRRQAVSMQRRHPQPPTS